MSLLDEVIQRVNGLPEAKKQELIKTALEGTKDKLWVPNPGPQTKAYYSEADELFYGGQAGGGKTDLLCGLALNEHEKSLILRRTNKEAEKIPGRFEEIVGNDDGLNRSTGTWRIGKKVIDMGGCQLEQDKQKRKGIPHDLKAFDEISDFTETQYRFICAWNRSANPDQRCRIVATGNPPTTAEGYWVIRRWAAWLDPKHPNPAKDGELRWYTTIDDKDVEVDGPGPHDINGEQVYARSRTFIRAKLSDNPDLAATDYDAVLASLPERERAAYRDGRFDLSVRDEPNQTIPTAWIRLAQERWKNRPEPHIPMCAIGVDMSGGGKDPMIMAPRYDGWFDELIEVPAKEFDIEKISQQAAGHILMLRRDKALIVLDLGGGYGSGTYEHLKANDIEVYGYKGSEGAQSMRAKDINMLFQNKRSAAIWRFREALDPSQPGGSCIGLPDDPELVADLTAPSYKIENNTIKIESKDKVVERLGRSTDKGDAVVMAWFQGPKETNSSLDWLDRKEQRKMGGMAPKVILSKRRRR